jgi:hypothetical protein
MWRLLSWVLFAAFLVAAALNMTHTSAGFATNHLADLVGPAWLYIAFRGLAQPEKRNRLGRFLGATPERAATILFVGSAATEIAQIYWPAGVFSGRFDPLDIAAFAIALLRCSWWTRSSRPGERHRVTFTGRGSMTAACP